MTLTIVPRSADDHRGIGMEPERTISAMKVLRWVMKAVVGTLRGIGLVLLYLCMGILAVAALKFAAETVLWMLS